MGGEVIIIAQDPDVRVVDPKPRPTVQELETLLQSEDQTPVHINPDGSIGVRREPKVQVTQATLRFSDAASPDDIALAVGTVLRQAAALKDL